MDEYIKSHKSALGLYLFLRRKELGLSQRQVAETSGLNRGVISEIEIGENDNPMYVTLLKLAYALKLDLNLIPAENMEAAKPADK